MSEVVILSAVRTPIGRLLGNLAPLPATDLGAAALREAVQRANLNGMPVDEVIMGQVVQAGAGQAPARQAALNGGLPATTSAMTINKVCGSGLKAVMLAANGIRAGMGEIYVAGGMESMSNAPHLVQDVRHGRKYGNIEMVDANLNDALWCSFCEWPMGNAAEFIAEQFDVSREEMDAFALESHQRAIAAMDAGHFDEEIVPVEIHTRKGVVVISTDEPPRRTTSLEALASLRPAFDPAGKVTAGNAPSLNDGASALVLASRAKADELGVEPLATVVDYAQAAVEPQWIFSAPAKALPKLLNKLEWSLEDVDLIELNEAFAAQVLANKNDMAQQGLELDMDKVNVHGGAVALGHPVGASGARVLTTLIYALKQRGLKRGIAGLCLGGGEAVALAVELA